MAYLGFCEGGQSQRRKVRGAGGANGWSVGRGCPLPTEEGIWGGGCAPSPEILKKIFWFNVFKKIVLRPKGGGASPSGPPKYATDIDIYSSLQLASLLLELTCHMGSHSVTFHPVEVAFQALLPAKLAVD